jgi:cytosine/uracil/thiamine/allantoin permease
MAGWLSLLDWWYSVQCLTGSEEATTYFDEDMEEVRWITFLMQIMMNTVFQCYSFVKFYILDVMIFIRKTTLSQVQNVY